MSGVIIVPYRDREGHLKRFVPHVQRFLKQKGLQIPIFIIEQAPGKLFNRAKLFNIGASFAGNFTYFIFHDVDMLPIIADYSYPDQPTHIATHCSQFGYTMPDPNYFGGVTLINIKHFIEVNGFSNDFWGWGYEDEEFRERFKKKGISIQRRQCTFECFDHPRPVHWTKYYQLKKSGQPLPPEFIQYEKNKELHANPDMSKGYSTLEFNTISIDQSIPDVVKITVDI